MTTSILTTAYSSASYTPEQLAQALLIGGSTITVLDATYTGADSATSFCNASIDGIGTVNGILITSGDGTPPISNTQSGYSAYTGSGSDADLLNVVTTAFPGLANSTYDKAILEFTFTVPDGTTSVRFDLIFGSEEFPYYIDDYVDAAAVFVDGTNYALFNGSIYQPLSVTSSNVTAGNFYSNQDWYTDPVGSTPIVVPLEYNGISKGLSVIAPLGAGVGGVHTIKIGIADTNDSALDSGLFIGNMTTNQAYNGGLKVLLPGTDNPETVTGGDEAELTYCYNGDDVFFGNGGDDVCFGGQGNDSVNGGDGFDNLLGGQGDDSLKGNDDQDYLKGGVGNDTAWGGLGDDTVKTGAGDDSLFGGEGNDVVSSQFGNDTFEGGTGNDTLVAGDGNDQFVFNPGDGDDRINGWMEGDLLNVDAYGTSFGALTVTQVASDTLVDLPGGDSILIAGVSAATIGAGDFIF